MGCRTWMKILHLMYLRTREGKELEKVNPAATFLSATENINSVRKYLIKFMLMITLYLSSTVLRTRCTRFSRKWSCSNLLNMWTWTNYIFNVLQHWYGIFNFNTTWIFISFILHLVKMVPSEMYKPSCTVLVTTSLNFLFAS